jgi:hypothetical protein
LHAGWSWRKNKDGSEKLNLDGIHLSTAGKYLAGGVWYQTLFNTDQVPTGYLPAGLTAEDAADLRGFAAQAVTAQRASEAAPAVAK